MLRIFDLWSKIVGNESKLFFALNSVPESGEVEKDIIKKIETTPMDNELIIIEQLKKGACYKVSFFKTIY